VTVKL